MSPLLPTRVRPNPSSGTAEATLTLRSDTYVRVTILDALGRQAAVVADGVLQEGETVLAVPDGLAPGTYLLRVEVPGAVKMLTFTVVR